MIAKLWGIALGLLALLAPVGVGVWWIETRFGTVAAAVALGGLLALVAWVGGSLFTHRIKQQTQADMLDGLGEMAGTVQSLSGAQRIQAQAALIDRRAEYEAERRIQQIADQRVKLLLADRQAAERADAARPTWIGGVEVDGAPLERTERTGPRYVE